MTSATVPMLAPDGTPGDIPQARVQDAVKAGFKPAVSMTSPDGKTGYIPQDRQQDALSAGFKLTGPAADTRSLFQRAKDNFNATTQGAQPGDGAIKSFVENVGAGGGDVIRSLAHPINTLKSMAPDVTTPTGIAEAALGPAGKPVVDTIKGLVTQPARTIGQIGTGAILGEAGTAAVKGAVGISDAASAAKAKLYPTSQSLTTDVSAARNLSKALVVDPAGVSNFVKAAADEAGTVVDYAQKNNLPINSKVDFANAAKSAADAVQSHYNDTLLGPNSKEVAAVPSDYRGPTVTSKPLGNLTVPTGPGAFATLGDINARIDAINQELSPNYRKGLAMQTSAANVSDADLIAEKRALTSVLHTNLAQATGLEPEDIAAVRQQAGKLRTIADEANLSANRDLTAAGRQGMGAVTTSSIGTKAGIIDRGLQFVQGGPEVIGNRQVLSALQKVTPKPLNLPQPIAAAP